jgi:hypothetical protein
MPSTTQCCSIGTLSNFRARYGHSIVHCFQLFKYYLQASFHVEKSFNYSYDLMRFTIHTYVLACAMKFMDFEKNSLDWVSDDMRKLSKSELASVLDGVARKILNFEWHDVSASICRTGQ